MKVDTKFYGSIFKYKDHSQVSEDEYVVFLAKDTAFANILPQYFAECARLGADMKQLKAVCGLIERVKEWRTANPDACKAPDAAGEQLADPTDPRKGIPFENLATSLPKFKPSVFYHDMLNFTSIILEDVSTSWVPWRAYGIFKTGHAVDLGYSFDDGRLVGVKIWDDVRVRKPS